MRLNEIVTGDETWVEFYEPQRSNKVNAGSQKALTPEKRHVGTSETIKFSRACSSMHMGQLPKYLYLKEND